MAAVHILIFVEMAGLKIVPFIATHVKRKKFFHGAMKKRISANQNSPSCMKTTDIKLFNTETKCIYCSLYHESFPRRQNLDAFKLEEFADNIFLI